MNASSTMWSPSNTTTTTIISTNNTEALSMLAGAIIANESNILINSTTTSTIASAWTSTQVHGLQNLNSSSSAQLVLLEQHRRLEVFGPSGQATVIVLYSLVSFLAFTTNSLVILVELYGKRSAPNLKKFLINLAISDLLLGVLAVPFAYTHMLLGQWIFPPIMCPTAQWVSVMSQSVNTFTLSFIGLERYFATLHPLSSANIWIRSNYNVVLLLGWLFGALIATFYSMDVVVGEKVHIDPATGAQFTYLDCMHWETREVWENQLYVSSLFVLTFVLPMAFLTVSYGAIGRRLLTAQRHWCRFKHTGGGGGGGGGNTVNNNGGGNGSGGTAPLYSVANSATRTASNNSGGGKAAESENDKTEPSKPTKPVKQNGFIRNKPSRQSIKPSSGRSAFGCARNGSSSHANSSSLEAGGGTLASSIKNPTEKVVQKNNSNRNKSVRLYASQENAVAPPVCTNTNNTNEDNGNTGNGNGNGNNGKVLICFDRRNTEFLNKMRVFRLLVAVLVVFLVCWLPMKIFIIVIAYNPQIVETTTEFQFYAYYITYFTCHLLAMANSFANPILYSFMSLSFRADLLDLFVCICTKLQVNPKSAGSLNGQRSTQQPPTPQTYQHNNNNQNGYNNNHNHHHHYNNHFHFVSGRTAAASELANGHKNNTNNRLTAIKESKKVVESTKAERAKLTTEKSSTSGGGCGGRPSTASSASGAGEHSVGELRSNHSSGKAAKDYSVSRHSNHSRAAGRSSARSSIFDDF